MRWTVCHQHLPARVESRQPSWASETSVYRIVDNLLTCVESPGPSTCQTFVERISPRCTLEMDPGTFDAARLEAYLEAGVTRVSLGVQSFDATQLRVAGRAHTLADAERALELVLDERRCPGLSVSIDLISGLPEQNLETWHRSLDLASSCGAHHVSVYDLQLEWGTHFSRQENRHRAVSESS